MKIYIGADHRGFALKQQIKPFVFSFGETVDLGADMLQPGDDYVDYAQKVAEKVSVETKQGLDSRGIVICGSGVGVDVVANKFGGIRSGLGFSPDEIRAARHDDNINILSIPADNLTEIQAKEIIKAFLETRFGSDEKYKRRIEKIEKLEKKI